MLVKDSALKREIDLLDEEEMALINEEKKLLEEQNLISEKHRSVDLVHTKVLYNIMSIIKHPNYYMTNIKDRSPRNNDENKSSEDLPEIRNSEEDNKMLIENYNNYLKVSMEKLKSYTNNNSKEDFKIFLKKKGLTSNYKNNDYYIPKSVLDKLPKDNIKDEKYNDIEHMTKLKSFFKNYQGFEEPTYYLDKEDPKEVKIEKDLIEEIRIAAVS